jgi:hypothetical protein
MHDHILQMRLTFADVVFEATGEVVSFSQRHVGGHGDADEDDRTGRGAQQAQLSRWSPGPLHDETRDPLPLELLRMVAVVVRTRGHRLFERFEMGLDDFDTRLVTECPGQEERRRPRRRNTDRLIPAISAGAARRHRRVR